MLRTHRTTAKPCPSHPKAAVPRCCPGALSAVGEAAGGEQGRGARGSCSSRPPAAHHPGAHRAPLQPLAWASAAIPAPWGRGRHRHGPGRITAITPAEFPGERGLSPPPTASPSPHGGGSVPIRPPRLGAPGSPGAPSRSSQAAARLAPFSAALNIPLGRRAHFIKQTIERQSSPALIAQQQRSHVPVKTL